MPAADSLATAPPRQDHSVISEKQVLSWLEDSHVFKDLTRSDLSLFLSSLRILNFKPMDEVISHGKFSAALYIVTGGRFMVIRPPGVSAHTHSDDDDADALDTFVQGDCFGEYSLIDQKPASASVVAAEKSQAIQIPRPAFQSALMSDFRIANTVYLNLLHLLTARLRRSLQV